MDTRRVTCHSETRATTFPCTTRRQYHSPRILKNQSIIYHRLNVNATSGDDGDTSTFTTPEAEGTSPGPKKRRQADSTDAIASALTRRFGLAGGLAWIGFLSAGVIGEQVKTRMEVAAEKTNTKDVSEKERVVEQIPGTGIEYYDIKRGGGSSPRRGDLVVLQFQGYAVDGSGDRRLFVDTSDTGKPIVFIYKSRPFTAGMCSGLELALEDMKAGGKRHVEIPAEFGFGQEGISLQSTRHVPDKSGIVGPNMSLVYDVELVRVSIPPS